MFALKLITKRVLFILILVFLSLDIYKQCFGKGKIDEGRIYLPTYLFLDEIIENIEDLRLKKEDYTTAWNDTDAGEWRKFSDPYTFVPIKSQCDIIDP